MGYKKDKKTGGFSLGSIIKSFDFFGSSIGFNIGGKTTYGSYIGAFCSFIAVFVTLSYAWRRQNVMLKHGDTIHLET